MSWTVSVVWLVRDLSPYVSAVSLQDLLTIRSQTTANLSRDSSFSTHSVVVPAPVSVL